ncbi:hypothetical protein REPUB_Repub20aG0024500 [Reevesia pubescens]
MEYLQGRAVTDAIENPNIQNAYADALNNLQMKFKEQLAVDSEPNVVDGVGAEIGHVIRTTIGGRNGQSKQNVSYVSKHVVGTGSFTVVFQDASAISSAQLADSNEGPEPKYKLNLNKESYWWYLDLRRYGSAIMVSPKNGKQVSVVDYSNNSNVDFTYADVQTKQIPPKSSLLAIVPLRTVSL